MAGLLHVWPATGSTHDDPGTPWPAGTNRALCPSATAPWPTVITW